MSHEPKMVRPTTAKRSIQWPTIESTHRMRIKGDGDVSIKEIVFSSDGAQFVVNCELSGHVRSHNSVYAFFLLLRRRQDGTCLE